MCYMNKIVALLVLASCATATSYPPDSPDGRIEHEHDARSTPSIDASVDALQPDAAPPHTEGCNMGLLPNARTTTLVNGDPISPDLLNEIQDNIIGAKRRAFVRRFYPYFFVAGSWTTQSTAAGSPNRPGITTAGVTAGLFAIPYEVGDRLTALTFQGCGNGVTDVNFSLIYAADYVAATATIGSAVETNRPVAWATVNFSLTSTPVMVDGDTLYVVAAPSASGYTIGQVSATFDRL
jgi:hypothetical protein